MSWRITPTQPVPVDPVFNNVSLLLHGNGTNGSTTITDSSPTPKTVTAAGNAPISTAQSKFGGASIAFDGAGDYLLTNASNDFLLDGDFTIEGFIYLNTVPTVQPGIIHLPNATGGNNFYLNFRGSLVLGVTNTTAVIALSPSFSANTWQHFAVTRSSNTLRVYANGSSGTAVTNSVSFGSSTLQNFIGADRSLSSNNFFNGYIDDLRITKGVARYTSNFTPPTAPFPDI